MLDLSRFPRLRFGSWPSPLEHMRRLSDALGGPQIWFKRDDLVGPGLGGNKVRKLEFLIADALEHGADTVITTGAAQSNHSRLTAAAANRAGLDSILVLRGKPDAPRQGNLLLDDLLGSEVHLVDVERPHETWDYMRHLASNLTKAGRRPYLIPVGGSNTVGAVGYVTAVEELRVQVDRLELPVRRIYHASSSGGTQAGLVVGANCFAPEWRILGIEVDGFPNETRASVQRLASELAERVGVGTPEPDTIDVRAGFAGEGYGIVSDPCREAIRLVAQTEGIFLDPVYSGKAMAGLIADIQSGDVTSDEAVIFVHTGGVPALFAYADDLR